MRWRRVVDIIAIMILVGAIGLGSSGAASIRAGSREPRGPAGREAGEDAVDRPNGPSGAVGSRRATVVHAVRLSTSPPVRSLPPYEPPAHPQMAEPIDDDVTRVSTGAPAVRDTALQRSVSTQSMPSTDDDFPGISGSGYVPPDTVGDVGPNNYVQAVNVAFRVWNKSGTPLTSVLDISSLFNGTGDVCETTDQGDPIVQYDQLADRWLISQFAFDVDPQGDPVAPFYQCVAVSTGPNPTGTYYRYAFLWPNNRFNDYPKIGVWPDGYYMTANEFSAAGGFKGAGVAAFDRSQMLTGGQADMLYFSLPNDYSLLPGDLDGDTLPPNGAPNTFASVDDAFLATRKLRLFQFHADFATPANATFTALTSLTPATYDPDISCLNNGVQTSECVPQPGVGQKLDSLPDRLMWRLAYRNYGDHQSIVVTHNVDANGSERAGVRWYELRKTTGAWSIYQQGTYSPDNVHRWMSSAAMDADGNMAVGYSASSSSTFPSIRFAGRLAGDPLGQLAQGEAEMIAGGGSQTSGYQRWGDYSSMTVDPDDDCTFWYTNEYYVNTSSNGWKTRIGHFKFPSCAANGSLSIDDVSIGEGDAGTSTATFTVTANPSPTQSVTVDYDTSSGTASSPSDYASTSGQLTFNPGDTTETVDVTINGDTTYEPDETFSVDLSNAAGGASIADAQGTGTITNDDPIPPGFTVDDVSVDEGNTGTTPATFTVTLTPASGSTETVDVATSDGTANSPSDYTPLSTQTLTFTPGQTAKQVTVDVNGDLNDESNETFFLDLTNGSSAINDPQGKGTIVDDDAPAGSCTVTGTSGNDELTGTSGDDVICGLGGDDTIHALGGDDDIDGGPGYDLVAYDLASGPVTANLATGRTNGAEGNDTLTTVEDVAGSNFADTLTGDASDNFLYGLAGNDTINGGSGYDLASYNNSPSGVTVNLKKGTATGGEGADTLSGIEDVYGSDSKDTITGRSGSNFLYGLGGNDTLNGVGGADELFGLDGNDTFNGGKGYDRCTQGPGSGSKKACEYK